MVIAGGIDFMAILPPLDWNPHGACFYRVNSIPENEGKVILTMNRKTRAAFLLPIILLCLSCSKTGTAKSTAPDTGGISLSEISDTSGEKDLPDLADAIARFSRRRDVDPDSAAFIEDYLRWLFGEAGIPESFAQNIAASLLEGPAFFMEFFELLNQDPYTYFLVDKKNPLPDRYEPQDLVTLGAGVYRVSRDNLELRKIAADALEEMARAAAAEGITLTVGSAYRSFTYQTIVYDREVKTYGKETADRQSAQPGKSQHQLGMVVDFSPIDDAFAETPASRWLQKNAGRFGWSLSFPDGYEEVTGYRWESWHYRYVGRDLAAFIDTYFEGIQQYALQFIRIWQEQE